jgi:phosphonoacetate hydrolase
MTSAPGPEIRLNGVRYRWPDRPVVVVCNDGGDPAYFDRALKDGVVPNVARFMETGFCAIAQCVIPSFTCPNNVIRASARRKAREGPPIHPDGPGAALTATLIE